MEKHIKVARAHRALSWLYAAIVLLFTVIFLMPSEQKASDLELYLVILGIFGGLFALHHFIARGAREQKPWARIASTIVACAMLLGFPLGTLIGIYLLANNWYAPKA